MTFWLAKDRAPSSAGQSLLRIEKTSCTGELEMISLCGAM